MKHVFLKLTGKKLLTAVFLSASVLLTSFSVNAAVTKGNNEKLDNFTVNIKNGGGDVLFSKSFKDVDFNKSFKLLKSGDDSERYYFTITSTNKNLEDSYVVTSTARTVEDVAVNKL